MSKGSVPWPSLNALEAVMPAVGADPAHPRGQSVEKLSPRETIVRAVIRGLYEGRYEPGQRLLESELTAAFGVSRGPVREALNRLAAMGAIELTLQRGAQVRVLTIDQAIDILVVVQALIGTAARLAASRIGAPGAAAHMRAALEAVETFDPADRSAEYAIARDGFYRALTSIANNS
jgi:DNA-binding GntR family transcriptional regulator